MDPISQAFLGASLSQSCAKDKSNLKSAMWIGALSGMAADLDILIRSASDPLLFLEFHRQFTHSLIFIPIGALLCALFFYPILKSSRFKSALDFRQIYFFSFLGYATHGLLDACTSYGTQLFWPFSNDRIAWNTVSIIDPFFTLPIIVLCLLAVSKQRIKLARFAFAYAVVFLAAGLIQKQRATETVLNLAEQRGHTISRLHIKPSFANRHVWKSIYEYNNKYYVDAEKLLWNTEVIEGDSIEKLNLSRNFSWLPKQSQQAKDIERFRWFSSNYLAISATQPNVIVDMRYSFVPNQINPMWFIKLDKEEILAGDTRSHVEFIMNSRPNAQTTQQFLDMIF